MQFLVIRTPRLPALSQISNGAAHRTGRRSTHHTVNISNTVYSCWLPYLFPMFLGFRTLRKGLKPPTKKTFACPFNEKTKRWNSVWTFGSALYKFQRIWSEKKEFDTNGLITCRYRYRGYIPVCFKKSLPTFP